MRVERLDPMKHALRAALWALHGTLRSQRDIEYDLEHAADPVTRALWEAVRGVAVQVERSHQRRMILEFGGFAVWLAYKDSAYRDVRDALLQALAEKHDVRTVQAKPAREWYVNAYEEAVAEQHARIAAGTASEEERAQPDRVSFEV
jgi:hypothetical protein